jgi:superfamily II DNA or RNA helicase
MSTLLKSKKLHHYQEKSIDQLTTFFKDHPAGKGYLHIGTGGGKTLVTKHYIIENWLLKGKKVLWLAWDWELLSQAHRTMVADFNKKINCVYISDSKTKNNLKLREVMPEFDQAVEDKIKFSLMYSSMQTFRNFDNLPGNNPDLIVVDEAHYGKNGSVEKEIFEYAQKKNIPILGLSATPKKRRGWEIIDSINFKDLVKKGFLATPIFESVSTNMSIDASRSNAKDAFNLIRDEVYAKLSKSKLRNEKIVGHYNKKKHGKTIVFAIDIDHAEKLAVLFDKAEIAAYPIHGDRSDAKQAIDYFRKNKFDVAIVVDMFNQGIDIPDVKTLFITKPVTSDILYSQMIGRGARLHEETGKKTFLVVDFEDNFVDEELRKMIFEPKVEYFGSGEASKSIYSTKNRVYKKRNKPEIIFPMNLQMFNIRDWDSYNFKTDKLNLNLPLLTGQTFGVELEFTTENIDKYLDDEVEWDKVAKRLFSLMKSALPENLCGGVSPYGDKYFSKDYTKFNLVYDGSCGWEIVSPVLMGKPGFEVLDNFLKKLNKGLETFDPKIILNHTTGLHVHFGFNLQEVNLPLFLSNLWGIETHIACLLPPSRMNAYLGDDLYDSDDINEYCSPLCNMFDLDELKKVKNKNQLKKLMIDEKTGEVDRYLSINFKNLLDRDGINTLEVRSHSGTSDPAKILSWISMWMGIFDNGIRTDFSKIIFLSDDVNPGEREFKELPNTLSKILPRHSEMIQQYLKPRSSEVYTAWKKHIFKK